MTYICYSVSVIIDLLLLFGINIREFKRCHSTYIHISPEHISTCNLIITPPTFTFTNTHTHPSTYKAQLTNIAYYQIYLNSTKQTHTHKQTHEDMHTDRNTPTYISIATQIDTYTYTHPKPHPYPDIHLHLNLYIHRQTTYTCTHRPYYDIISI